MFLVIVYVYAYGVGCCKKLYRREYSRTVQRPKVR